MLHLSIEKRVGVGVGNGVGRVFGGAGTLLGTIAF
jgi:hypothetical protein